MAYSVHHYTGGAWVDISNYVLTALKYPAVDRERNYEPRATGISFDVSWNYSNELLSGDDIKIEDGSSNVVYSGYIASSRKNYDSRIVSVEINNYLLELQKYNITYDNLYTRITADAVSFASGLVKETDWTITNEGQEDFIVSVSHGLDDGDVVMFDEDSTNGVAKANTVYFVLKDTTSRFQICTDSALTNPVQFGDWNTGAKYITQTNMDEDKFFEDFGVQVLHLIDLLFVHAGLTLSKATVATSIVFTGVGLVQYALQSFTIRFDDLWRVNQTDSEINNDSLITYWQFIQKFLAATGTIIECNGAKSYILKRSVAENLSNNDDDYWDYAEELIEAKHDGVQFELREDGTAIDQVDDGTGKIEWYENLIYYKGLPDEAAASQSKWLPSELDSSGNDTALKYYKRALTQDYTEKRYKINRYTTSSAVVQNMVNISITEPVSEIVEEVY